MSSCMQVFCPREIWTRWLPVCSLWGLDNTEDILCLCIASRDGTAQGMHCFLLLVDESACLILCSECVFIDSSMSCNLCISDPCCKVVHAPTGTQAASLDIELAYHNSPIVPRHKAYLAISWNRSIFIGHCT